MARKKKQDDDEPQENQDNLNQDNLNNDSDDTFGLPEVEYEPINRDEPIKETVVEETVYETPLIEDEPRTETFEYKEEVPDPRPYEHEEHVDDDHNEYRSTYVYEKEAPMWPKALAILAGLLLVGLAIFYFAYYQPKQKEERRALIERQRKEAADIAKRDEQKRLAEQQRLEAEQRRADSLANLKKEGSIEVLSQRTGQYYVVVASAIDDDLLMDYANKLIKSGKQVKIIPPTGRKGRFHRLAIDAKDTYEDAQTTADGLKGNEFGNQLWVVKY